MFKKRNFKLIVVVTVSTIVLLLEDYHRIPLRFPACTQIIFYLLIPLLINCLLFREKPSDYGFCLGNWKLGLLSIAICLSIMVGVIYTVAHLESFSSFYKLSKNANLSKLFLANALYLFSWEFLFRGYMLFGLTQSIGKNAIFIQAIPFALLHSGKVELEALTSLFGGYVLGYISYWTGSFLPCFVIHMGIYVMMRLFS
jgi:membrane protease YdiL (CAAX protease family)